jgi:hypothetical protein
VEAEVVANRIQVEDVISKVAGRKPAAVTGPKEAASPAVVRQGGRAAKIRIRFGVGPPHIEDKLTRVCNLDTCRWLEISRSSLV